MDFSMVPQSTPLDTEFDSNPTSEYEWDALEKFLEWQQGQPERFSSPESLISESHFQSQQFEYPIPVGPMTVNTSQANNQWNQLSPESLSPMSSFSPPHSMPEEFQIKRESSHPPHKTPKVGRPRSTPVSEPGSYKTPTHARRRNQNREAQRAFRARQRKHLEEVAQENKDLVTRNRELEERCEKLARAYERVLSDRMDNAGNQTSSLGAFGMPWNMVSNNLYKKEGE